MFTFYKSPTSLYLPIINPIGKSHHCRNPTEDAEKKPKGLLRAYTAGTSEIASTMARFFFGKGG